MGRVGALLGAGLDQAVGLAGLEHRLQQEPFGTAGDEAGAELAEDGEVEAGVGQLQAEGVLPVDAAADGVGGLAIGEPLGELQDRDQGQPPGGLRRLSPVGEQAGEAFVVVEGAQGVPHGQVGVAVGEGGAGDVGGQFRDAGRGWA